MSAAQYSLTLQNFDQKHHSFTAREINSDVMVVREEWLAPVVIDWWLACMGTNELLVWLQYFIQQDHPEVPVQYTTENVCKIV